MIDRRPVTADEMAALPADAVLRLKETAHVCRSDSFETSSCRDYFPGLVSAGIAREILDFAPGQLWKFEGPACLGHEGYCPLCDLTQGQAGP